MDTFIDKVSLGKLALEAEQLQVDTLHHFFPNMYFREIKAYAGSILVGHYHKESHVSQCLSGELELLKKEGNIIVKAPWVGLSDSGSKVALVTEDLVWLNIFNNPNNIQDIGELESMFFDISSAFNNAIKIYPEGIQYIKTIKPLPYGIYKFRERFGRVFATATIQPNEVIGEFTGTVLEKSVQVGTEPNVEVFQGQLFATKLIKGCLGGLDGEELQLSLR